MSPYPPWPTAKSTWERRLSLTYTACCHSGHTHGLLLRKPSQRGILRHGIFRIRPVVEPLAVLLPVPPRHHHALQQRRGRETPLLKFVEHHVRDVIRRVQPDKIQQCERPHGISAAQLHCRIDVADRPYTFLVRADCIEQIGY